jgi:alpha-glucosidase (family GH31 glycosyl hydrolase)
MIAAGGMADIYYIVDTTPTQVLSSYLNIVGKPVMIPQWALGWHQCRWGYNTTEQLRNVVAGYKKNHIPLDTVWSDIDYMYNYRDFTFDSKQKFRNLTDFVESIHKDNMKYVPIIDAGIAMRSPGEYPAYDRGLE